MRRAGVANGVWQNMAVGCRYEVDKLSSSQRLDLNLEKGRMRDELQALRDKSNEMEIKMDRCELAHPAALLAILHENTECCAVSLEGMIDRLCRASWMLVCFVKGCRAVAGRKS